MDVRLVGLQQLRFRRDGNRFGQRADLERHVDAGDLADRDRHVRAHGFLEAGQRDLDVVRTGQDVRQRVHAFGVRHRVARQVRFLVDGRDRRARHGRALGILHNARDAAVKNLRVCGDRDEREARNGQ